jgi:ParB-like chromosome segregation protein Spo0J
MPKESPSQVSIFQIMPPLSEDEFSALKDDIADRGIMVPVEYDEVGNVLDGHHRIRAARELGLTEWPRMIRAGMTDEQKRRHVRALNLARRHLNQEQRRGLLADQLRDTPEESDRQIARGLGVSHVTVGAVRSELESIGQIDQCPGRQTSDGRTYPSERKPRERPVSMFVGDESARTDADVLREAREVKRRRAQERVASRESDRAVALTLNHPLGGEAYRLAVADCAKWFDLQEPGSIDAIITDPPYPEEFLPVYGTLSFGAARVLKPGGHCLVMCGQSHLSDVMAYMEQAMKYQWTLAYLTPGQSTQVFGRRVKSNWKPVLWYTNGKTECEHVEDSITSDENDKRFHRWGQSVGGMLRLVERFTVRGELVCDPFCGAGTTGVASVLAGRLFVGVDIDEACIRRSAERLTEVTSDAAGGTTRDA